MVPPELYIISDLHLCDGSRVEDFRPDDERALVSFLFRLSRLPLATLIINGDFIDFVQIQPRPEMWQGPHFDASEAESLEKLDGALRAHGPVFDALARFVTAGHQLRFHWGNHDIDLVWPAVQARLRERLGESALHPRISFGGEYHAAGLYVAHGHRADPANSFVDEPDVIHTDQHGTPRLERCWGTRLVEEFYNKIETLDGCDMLDNVRPRMQAAVVIIKYAILHRHMHATLYAGVQIIVETLAQLRSDQDVSHAAEQLGVNRQVLGWLVSVAGWLGMRVGSNLAPKGAESTGTWAPSLQAAYAYGANLRDGMQLAQLAPSPEPRGGMLQAKGTGQASAPRAYDTANSQRYLRHATAIAAQYRGLGAICLGHTHQAITPELAVDEAPGWPLDGSPARYFNSGSWTRTLELAQLPSDALRFEVLADPRHYRTGRDYLRVTWPDGGAMPAVETRAWG